MPRHVDLPVALRRAPFTSAHGRAVGLGRERLLGRDLAVPFPGVRVARSVHMTFLVRCAALSLRLPDDTAFSHITAARIWGVPLPSELESTEAFHVVTARRGARIRVAGVVGHETSDGDGFRMHAGFRVTAPASTWFALAGMLHHDDLVAAGDHLVLTPRYPRASSRRPHIPIGDLAVAVEKYRGRHARRIRAAFTEVRDGAESRKETLLRLALVRRGLPEPLLNEEIFDDRGEFVGRADMYFPQWRVVVEYDGDQHRTDDRQFDEDVTRRENLIAAGNAYVSARKYGLGSGPQSGPARAERALRAAGWRPGVS